MRRKLDGPRVIRARGWLRVPMFAVAFASLTLTLPVAAQDRPIGPDQKLVAQLRQLGQDEIAMARLGEARGVRADVRSLSATLQRDQRAADERLIAYAQRKNMNRATIANPGDALPHGTLALAPL